MSDMQTIELQQPRSTNEQMVAEPTPQIQQRDDSSSDIEAQKPRLGMRGGGILLDLCACFICCEACDACCHAIDDCCCC